jgi:hypothetical protein
MYAGGMPADTVIVLLTLTVLGLPVAAALLGIMGVRRRRVRRHW